METKINPAYEEKKHKGKKLKIVIVVLVAITVLVVSFLAIFHLREVTFSGNNYYSDEELTDLLLSEGLSGNSLYVMMKYNMFNKEPDIPYIQGISVRMISPSHLQIEVSEKVVVGCVDYMGTYMYFDNEGVVVDSSSTLTEGVAVISGLSFNHMTLGEKLPVENDDIFERIMTLTRLLVRHSLKPDKIFFDFNNRITLYFADIKVELGTEENLKIKIADLAQVMPSLVGRCGILHMENYSREKDTITFSAEERSSEAPSTTEAPSTEEVTTEPSNEG